MTITPDTLVADIAAAVPASVKVFERHGVDFCCGGRKRLLAVCQEQHLSFDTIAQEIATAAEIPGADARDWTTAPLHELADHIVEAYHDKLRDDLPRLERLAARVHQVHGAREPFLLEGISSLVGELSADLNSHMKKEELVLFPAIRALEAGLGSAGVPLSAPVAVMEAEHDRAGDLLAQLRAITNGYEPPDWACRTFRALYEGLAELERDMHVHVHLENNVLFPRALMLSPAVEA